MAAHLKDKEVMLGRNHRSYRREQLYKDDFWYDFRTNSFPNWDEDGKVSGEPDAKNMDCGHAD